MEKNAGLSAPEAYLLTSLPRYDIRKALKLGFMGLLAQGVLRSTDETRTGLLRTRHIIHLRVAPDLPETLPPLTASLVKVVRAAEPRDGVMSEIIKQAMREYGNNLFGFPSNYVGPALAARGLAERRRVKFLGLIPSYRYERTPAGDAEKIRLENAIQEAKTIPRYLDSDPAQVAAMVAAVGGAIFLVDELQPHYQGISKAMRDQGGGGGGDTYFASDGGGSDSGGFGAGSFDAGSFDFGNIDFGSFDFGSFDAGFDGGGGDGGGDGGSSGC
ncbi:MAG TPA: hypothetical protein VN900_16210 [Stellaceae bacterium]|jgi:hypothetical protein|nr:hypothetical protein [Stellaceae bacterium]